MYDGSERAARIRQCRLAGTCRLVGEARHCWRGGRLGKAEIENLGSTTRQEDVGGLDVAMHNAPRVRSVQGIGERKRDLEQFLPVDRPAREPLIERLTFEQLHGDEWRVRNDVVDGADARVIEGRCCACFTMEAFECLVRDRNRPGENLDCDGAFEACVSSAVDFAHSAGSERRDDFVGTEARASGQGHESRVILAIELLRTKEKRGCPGSI